MHHFVLFRERVVDFLALFSRTRYPRPARHSAAPRGTPRKSAEGFVTARNAAYLPTKDTKLGHIGAFSDNSSGAPS